MIKKQFKCTLLSDVILNVKSASEGPNKTLDFIPGSCFLGIVASSGGYDDFDKIDAAMEVFHSGNVRFGDAHPSVGEIRSLKVPASMFYPKMMKPSERCYIHHYYDRDSDKEDNNGPQQLKQCRNGFYVFADGRGTPVECGKSFAIKSAHDSEQRRSRDEAMYGYESLDKGQEFFFEVETDNDSLIGPIGNRLCGVRHIGRSRTAQYGLVNISEVEYRETESSDDSDGYVTVYADGRLIFLDEYGIPTFRPDVTDLGLSTGEIDWDKTQIRTFQYAPWNFKRQAYDTDRCGIEKGSVFVIKGCTDKNLMSCYVGLYRNEGFGKIIYNPDFLMTRGDNGLALYSLENSDSRTPDDARPTVIPGDECSTPLLQYLNSRITGEYLETRIYKEVNEFVEAHGDKFRGDQFASQWGHIRSIASKFRSREDILTELFNKTTKKEKSDSGKRRTEEIPFAYLTHGVAAEKWGKRGRKDLLEAFLGKYSDDCETRMALINLASQMAKHCKR